MEQAKTTWTGEQWRAFYDDLLKAYLEWYMSTGTRLVIWARWLRRIVIFMGLTATALAAFPNELQHPRSTIQLTKWIVVVLTAIVTSAGAAQSRLAQAARSREAGRAAITQIEQSLKMAMLYEPMTEEERARRLVALPAAIAAVERQFGHDATNDHEKSGS